MSTGSPKRKRSALALPPGKIASFFAIFRRGDVLLRIGLCVLAAVLMWAITGAWAPPFSYRARYTPPRDIVARANFSIIDEGATDAARRKARETIVWYYVNDASQFDRVQQALLDELFEVVGVESYDELDATVWDQFLPMGDDALDDEGRRQAFDALRTALAEDQELESLKTAVQLTFLDYRDTGLLESLDHELDQGDKSQILVHALDDEANAKRVDVDNVRLAIVGPQIREKLAEKLRPTEIPQDSLEELADRLFAWLERQQQFRKTLTKNGEATERAADEAAKAVPPVMDPYEKGETLLGIKGGEPLDAEDIELLGAEHLAYVAQMSTWDKVVYAAADFGMYVAAYLMCGFYIFFRERDLLQDWRKFVTLLAFVVVVVGLVKLIAQGHWLLEMTPIVMFAMAVSITYRHELALLLASAVSLIVVLSLGFGLPEFVVYVATIAAASLLAVRVRSRTKLIYVGLCAGAVGLLTTMGVFAMSGQPFGTNLLIDAARYGFCAVLAGLLMTALLPYFEKVFDVQTDLSLLELGDAAHPLLQELVRRAPGTYNHSINVASIGEAAAESIGANGLLVRVGAYFHDIGKMLKPSYFIENQGQDNRHESLVPAMSTLVIIAHVKDGADLARQHHLPQTIIDFIEQHHGTTLVEYFYREATKKQESDPDGGEVDETNFRYPGPKPQTREAGVMMLADAVESASRTLVDPAPARIESLVREMAMKRLLDGQFDDCGLTLKELATIQDSLVKSMTAVYHGRVKYPGQHKTA